MLQHLLFVKIAGKVRTCLYFNECGQTEIHNGHRWKYDWNRYDDGWVCEKHGWHLVRKFLRSKESIKRTNQKKFHFLNKSIRQKDNPRTGYCSRCPNNLYDGSCKKTDTHHYFYMTIMPWACTIELCVSCHYYETFPSRNKTINRDKYNILICNNKMSYSIDDFF